MKNLFSKKSITIVLIAGIVLGIVAAFIIVTYPACRDWQSSQGGNSGMSGPTVIAPSNCAIYGI